MCCAPAAKGSRRRRCSATCLRAPLPCSWRHFGTDAALAAGLGAFLGHLFPVWLRFKGGKGVATYIGVLIGLYWPAALHFASIWLVDRRSKPLFLACRTDRERAHTVRPLGFQSAQCRCAVLVSDCFTVGHAPRQHRSAAQRHRRQDRRKSRHSQLNLRLYSSTIGCSAAPNFAGWHIEQPDETERGAAAPTGCVSFAATMSARALSTNSSNTTAAFVLHSWPCPVCSARQAGKTRPHLLTRAGRGGIEGSARGWSPIFHVG